MHIQRERKIMKELFMKRRSKQLNSGTEQRLHGNEYEEHLTLNLA